MKYRQITHRLRIQRGAGRPDLVSERPRKQPRGRFLDEDNPTLVEFDEHCQVDAEELLKMGAIVPYEEELPFCEEPEEVEDDEI